MFDPSHSPTNDHPEYARERFPANDIDVHDPRTGGGSRAEAAKALRIARSQRWHRGIGMTEVILAITVSTIVVVMVSQMALSAIARNNADARAAEVRIIVDTVWDKYVNAADYTGIDTDTIAGSLPEKMRSADGNSIFLGGGAAPVQIFEGDTTNAAAIGANVDQTFVLSIGTADFPLTTTQDCEKILGLYDNQEPRFRGFQLRSATGTAIGTAPVSAAAATNFSVKSAAGTTLTGVAEATAPASYYAAASYALRDVQASHITYACEKATDLDAGAVINLAFL